MSNEYVVRLPEVRGNTLEDLGNSLQEIVNIIEDRLEALEQAINDNAYSVSNFTDETRSLDGATATLSDTVDFLATLAQDMIDRGQLVGTRRFD